METEQNDDLISKCINFLNSEGYEAKEQIEEVFQMILDSDVNQLKPKMLPNLFYALRSRLVDVTSRTDDLVQELDQKNNELSCV